MFETIGKMLFYHGDYDYPSWVNESCQDPSVKKCFRKSININDPNEKFNCKEFIKTAPDLSLTIGEYNIIIHARALFQIDDKSDHYGNTICQSIISTYTEGLFPNYQMIGDPETIILGQEFLRYLFTVLDYEKK